MFKIEGNTIMLTRGDEVEIDFSVEDDYIFKTGDKLRFSVYKPRKLQELPLLEKIIRVTEDTSIIRIELTSEETKSLVDMKSRVVELWYEIEYNDVVTVLGYDEEGAKKIKIYPEGSEE